MRANRGAAVALVLVCIAPWAGHATTALEQGEQLAFAADKGNCLACHHIAGGTQMGDVGPPLVGMVQRYPDRGQLKARIFDATQADPNTLMPPFGRHRILNDAEIDLIVEFLYSQ